MRKFFLVLILGVSVGGWAVGNTHRYDLGDASLAINSSKTAAVMTIDMRPYVRSGDKKATFVGLQRGGYGNPFNINTRSGNPLADDMNTSIVESLKATNVNALAVATAPNMDLHDGRETLLSAKADRFALLVLREWKSDTYVRTALLYDVTLSILGTDGPVLGETELKGKDDLGGSALPQGAREKSEIGFKEKLELLFGDSQIKAALQ